MQAEITNKQKDTSVPRIVLVIDQGFTMIRQEIGLCIWYTSPRKTSNSPTNPSNIQKTYFSAYSHHHKILQKWPVAANLTFTGCSIS